MRSLRSASLRTQDHWAVRVFFPTFLTALRLAWTYPHVRRTVISTVATAVALSTFAGTHSLYVLGLPLGIFAVLLAFTVNGPNHAAYSRPAVVSVIVILGSALIGIPASIWWGYQHTDPSIVIAGWTLLMGCLFFTRHNEAIFWLMLPAWYLSAFMTIVIQAWWGIYPAVWLSSDPMRAIGLTDSPNVNAGFMGLGIVFLAANRKLWWALPLIVAIPLTGSRSATLVLLLTLGAMAVTRYRHEWRRIGMVTLIAIGLLTPFFGYTARSYRLGSLLTLMDEVQQRVMEPPRISGVHPKNQETAKDDADIAAERLPGLIPGGFIGAAAIHSTIPRMIREWGIWAAVAWLGLTVGALWRRPRFTPTWWMLTFFAGLTVLDYYPIMPLVISGFWWVLISMRLRHDDTVL